MEPANPGRPSKVVGTAVLAVAIFFHFFSASPVRAAEPTLQPGPVRLELSTAEVSIVLAPDASPRAVAAWVTEGGSQSAALSLESVEGVQLLSLPEGARDSAPAGSRLEVELELPVGHPLQLSGTRLELTVEDARKTAAPAPDSRRPAASAGLEISLTASQATLLRVRDAVVVADDSTVLLADGSGSLTLDLQRGEARVQRQVGNLMLVGAGAKFVVEEMIGAIAFDLAGGDLTADEGQAEVMGRAEGADLSFNALSGNVQIDAAESTVSLTRLRGQRLKLEGRQLQVLAQEGESSVNVRADGGRVTFAGHEGVLRMEGGQGAQLEVSDHAGDLFLDLSGGSAAVTQRVTGVVKAEVIESRLEAEAVGKLAATLLRGELVGRQVGLLNRVEATDAAIELDLVGVERIAPMTLRGDSIAYVELSNPCVVRALGADLLPGEGAVVNGCDLESPGTGERRVPAQRRYGGQAVVLNVHIEGDDTELEVSGR